MLKKLFTMTELRDWIDQGAENHNHSHLHPGIEFVSDHLEEFEQYVDDERNKKHLWYTHRYTPEVLDQMCETLYWIKQDQKWDERRKTVDECIKILSYLKEVLKDDSENL